AMINAIEVEDRAAVRSLIHASTKPVMAAADDFSLLMVTNRHFHRAIKAKFPDNKEDLLQELATDESLRQMRKGVANATFTIEGDTASAPTFGTALERLVRINGSWQFDFDRLRTYLDYPLGIAQ